MLYVQAPEILLGRHYDSVADLWSVGTILFQCWTGTAPFLVGEGEWEGWAGGMVEGEGWGGRGSETGNGRGMRGQGDGRGNGRGMRGQGGWVGGFRRGHGERRRGGRLPEEGEVRGHHPVLERGVR